MTFNSLEERNRFIEDNMKLVSSRVMKLNKNVFDEDLYQVGSVALIYATERFDENKGVCFSTYAVEYIDGYIMTFKNYDALIKPIRKRSADGYLQYKEIGSLNKLTCNEKITYEDTIYGYDTFEDDIIGDIFVSEFLSSLSIKHRMIVDMAMNKTGQREIAKIVGISQAQVHRILKKVGKRCKACYLYNVKY